MDKIKRINDDLIHFWDDAMKVSETDFLEYMNSFDKSLMDIVPAKKLYDKVLTLKDCKKVLDYGCGQGWASITLGLNGVFVDAVDMGDNIIKTLELYRKTYGEKENVFAFKIDSNWLKNVECNTYDGIICSNVLDVIPLETAKEIIFNFHRILKDGSTLIVGLNYYISEEQAKESKMELVDGRYLFIDGHLRLSSLTYFIIEELSYFKWEGEKKESRRLFVLKKK